MDETQRRREAYRNAASNLLTFGYEAHRVQSPTSGAWHPCQCSRGSDHLGDLPLRAAVSVAAAQTPAAGPVPAVPRAETSVRWHTAPPGADWTDHVVEPDGYCEAHMDSASRGEVPYGGWVETRAPSGPMPDAALLVFGQSNNDQPL